MTATGTREHTVTEKQASDWRTSAAAWVCLSKVVSERARQAKDMLKDDLLQAYKSDGTDRKRLRVCDEEVGTIYIQRRKRSAPRCTITDEMELVEWLTSTPAGVMAVERLVMDGRVRQTVADAALCAAEEFGGDGQVPRGVSLNAPLAEVSYSAAVRVDNEAFEALVRRNAEIAAGWSAQGVLPMLGDGDSEPTYETE